MSSGETPVVDPFADFRGPLAHRAWQSFYKPRAASICFQRGQKIELYDLAARTFGLEPITYLEFGVFKGWSMRQIMHRLRLIALSQVRLNVVSSPGWAPLPGFEGTPYGEGAITHRIPEGIF